MEPPLLDSEPAVEIEIRNRTPGLNPQELADTRREHIEPFAAGRVGIGNIRNDVAGKQPFRPVITHLIQHLGNASVRCVAVSAGELERVGEVSWLVPIQVNRRRRIRCVHEHGHIIEHLDHGDLAVFGEGNRQEPEQENKARKDRPFHN